MAGPGRPFQPGQSGNPRGRPSGSRHKLSEAFLANLSDLWAEEGDGALRMCLVEDPAAFCRIVASLLPKQSEKLPNPLGDFSDDELERLERILARELSSDQAGEGEADAGE